MPTAPILPRGGNVPLPPHPVSIVVSWGGGSSVDPCALLIDASGKVRGDEDFVFYNQPVGAGGAVQLSEAGTSATVTIDPAQLPPEVGTVVVAGSTDKGTFDRIPNLTLRIAGPTGDVATFPIAGVEPVAALVFGEIYQRNGVWKFRAVGQGWATGLAGLARHYGVAVEEDEPAATGVPAPAGAAPARPDWYPATDAPGVYQWWDGARWNGERFTVVADTPQTCGRCGKPKRSRIFGGAGSCQPCEVQISNVLNAWRVKAADVLAATGPTGARWDNLWAELRYWRIREDNGRATLHPVALSYLQQVVAFAFADELIEQHEVDGFEQAVTALGIQDPGIYEMRRRLLRGLELGRIAAGDVPRITSASLHLDSAEILHLDIPATQIRHLASGPKYCSGRLIATNSKLRFVGNGAGLDLAWAKVLEVRAEYNTVALMATTARGGGSYQVEDPERAAAVLTGVLKVAKRLAAAPATRDTRAIPQHIRSEVWRRDAGACVDCQATEYLEFDHIIPWSRGGATSVANLQLLCRRCNLAKGARI